MWMNSIHGGGAPQMTMQVYYTGTSTLYEGYALCFDFNAADVNQENAAQTSPDVGEEYFNASRRLLVEKPTEKNKIHFAGVVAEQSDGVTGPGWVTIHRPGSVCNVYAYSNCDHERSADANASGQLLNVVVGQWYMMDGGFPGTGAAMVLQDVDRSTTAGLVMAELMSGPPSGGYVDVVIPAATSSLSVQLSAIPVYAGVYNFVSQAAAVTAVILSTRVQSGDGKWIGQRCQFQMPAGATGSDGSISVEVSTAQFPFASASSLVSATIQLSAAEEFAQLEWSGVAWICNGAHQVNLSD